MNLEKEILIHKILIKSICVYGLEVYDQIKPSNYPNKWVLCMITDSSSYGPIKS